MFEITLFDDTKKTWEMIKNIPLLQDFYLAGGTNLALQLGYRKSIDLDFFIRKFPRNEQIISAFSQFSPTVYQNTAGTVDLIINHTKVSFLEYDYDLLTETFEYNGLHLASFEDVACMKAIAISTRGSKKDFIDLYFILQKYNIKELMQLIKQKYKNVNYSQTLLLRSFTYFADADNDEPPVMLENIPWSEIKSYITERVEEYFREQVGI